MERSRRYCWCNQCALAYWICAPSGDCAQSASQPGIAKGDLNQIVDEGGREAVIEAMSHFA